MVPEMATPHMVSIFVVPVLTYPAAEGIFESDDFVMSQMRVFTASYVVGEDAVFVVISGYQLVV